MARTVIDHATILTLDEEGTILEDAGVVVEGRTITSVGERPEPQAGEERIDGTDFVLMPAFFNAHCHSPMTFERGWAEDLPLDRWFNERIWVAESALTEEDVLWGARLAAAEMIRSGIVGFNDHYFYMDRVAETVEMSGMKACLTWCSFGIGDDKEVGTDVRGALDFAARWDGKAGGRIKTVIGPHSPYVCPPAFLRELAEEARHRRTGLHLHVAESPEQVAQSLERHGTSPVAHLHALGVLDVPVTLAHCLYVDDADLELLARDEVTIARCPITYMKLAMGSSDIRPFLDRGVAVGLGTDGPGSNSDMSMLATMRAFALLQKHLTGDATVATSDQCLRLATQGAARACGFSTSGVIEPGAPADLILVDTRRPHLRPRHDLRAAMVHTATAGDVTDVMCDGRWLMRSGELLTLDEATILREADRRARAMVAQDMHIVRSYDG